MEYSGRGFILAVLALAPCAVQPLRAHPVTALVSHAYTHPYGGVRLFGGQTYTIETRNLQPLDPAQIALPDTVLYVLTQGCGMGSSSTWGTSHGEIVAYNDDHLGTLASSVTFTPWCTDNYQILVRAKNSASPGLFELYIDNVQHDFPDVFGGTPMDVRWSAGQCFVTSDSTAYTDPALWLLDTRPGEMRYQYNDDTAPTAFDSTLCTLYPHYNNDGIGVLVLGSHYVYPPAGSASSVDLVGHDRYYHNNPH